MPLVDPTRNSAGTLQQLAAKPVPVQIAAPEYNGVTVDTKLIPVSELLSHVEGSSWTVNYYSQAIDLDSQVTGQGLGTAAVVQQYRLIEQMELKVTQPLTSSQDAETKTMTYVGTATTYPFVIPNKGDMFLASVGEGREGLFEVTDVQRLSIQKQACHTVEYQMIDWSNPTRLADLARKTIDTLHFVTDFLRYGQNPLLFDEEYGHLQALRKNFRRMVRSYFDSFFSDEYKTVILPGQDDPTYDPFLTHALLRTFTRQDSPKIDELRELNVDDDKTMRAKCIWDAILDQDLTALLDAFTQYGKVYAVDFSSDPMMYGIRWSGIIQVIYPNDPILSVDYNQQPPSKMVSGEILDQAPMKMTPAALINPTRKWLDDSLQDVYQGFVAKNADTTPKPVPDLPPPIIHNAMKDGYYVFSQAFYTNDLTPGAQSQLEIMVRAYLEGQSLNYGALNRLVDSITTSGLWNTMNKFYYIPILLILIRAHILSF